MKNELSLKLIISLFITLVLGTILVLHERTTVLFIIAYYALSFFVLLSFKYGKDFFLSYDSVAKKLPETPIVMGGQVFNRGIEENKQEDRFLSFFEPGRIVKRKILSILFLVLPIFIVYRQAGLSVSLEILASFVCGFFIIHAFYAGHLLIPLVLNILLVAKNFDTHYLWLTAAYTFFVIWTLPLVTSTEDQKRFFRQKINLLGLLTSLYLALTYGFGFVFKNEEVKKPIKKTNVTHLVKSLHESRKELSKLHAQLPAIKSMGGGTIDMEELGKRMNDQLSKSHSLESRLKMENLSEQDIGEIRSELSHFSMNQNQLKKEGLEAKVSSIKSSQFIDEEFLNNVRDVNSNIKNDADTIERLSKVLSSENGETFLKDVNRKLDETKENLKPLDELGLLSGSKRAEFNKDIQAAKEIINKGKLTETESTQLAQKLQTITKKVEAIKEEAKEKTNNSNHSPKPIEDLGKELKIPPKNDLIEKFIKYSAPLILFFVFFLIQYFLRKKGIKRVRGGNAEVIKDLKQEWKNQKKLKLSAREEVILFYNLLHDSLQKIHYEHETPPSCIVHSDMKANNPEIDKATFVVTEVFSQCFYGGKNVDDKSLKLFRKGLNKILSVYELI